MLSDVCCSPRAGGLVAGVMGAGSAVHEALFGVRDGCHVVRLGTGGDDGVKK